MGTTASQPFFLLDIYLIYQTHCLLWPMPWPSFLPNLPNLSFLCKWKHRWDKKISFLQMWMFKIKSSPFLSLTDANKRWDIAPDALTLAKRVKCCWPPLVMDKWWKTSLLTGDWPLILFGRHRCGLTISTHECPLCYMRVVSYKSDIHDCTWSSSPASQGQPLWGGKWCNKVKWEASLLAVRGILKVLRVKNNKSRNGRRRSQHWVAKNMKKKAMNQKTEATSPQKEDSKYSKQNNDIGCVGFADDQKSSPPMVNVNPNVPQVTASFAKWTSNEGEDAVLLWQDC